MHGSMKTARLPRKNCAKLLKNNPSNEEIQKSFWSERRTYKALIRNKTRASVAFLRKELREVKSNNPREFWRLINKISDQSGGEEIPISVDVLGEYFKSLLDDKSEDSDINPSVRSSHTVPILDEPIDDMEVRAALKALKKNKAPGLDGLPPLVFKIFHDQLVTFATVLFNKLLEQEAVFHLEGGCPGISPPSDQFPPPLKY